MIAPSLTIPTRLPSVVGFLGGDPSASRVVYGIVVALILIGVTLVLLAIWLVRQTRVDPELLAPLEAMSDRKWRKLDPASQRRLLDDERPEGARPLMTTPMPPSVDAEFEAGELPVTSFEDLVPVAAVPIEESDGTDEAADDTNPLERDSSDGSDDDAADSGDADDGDADDGDAGDVVDEDQVVDDADDVDDVDDADDADDAADETPDLADVDAQPAQPAEPVDDAQMDAEQQTVEG